MDEKSVNESLEHIRLIHFTLLLACGTIIYLVLSSWTPANELVLDLKGYVNLLNKVGKTYENDEVLAEILPDWEAVGVAPAQRALSERLGMRVVLHDQSRKLLKIVSKEPAAFPDTFESLGDARNALEKVRWKFIVVGDMRDDAADVRQWLRETTENGKSPNHNGWREPLILLNVKGWPFNAEANRMEALAEVEVRLVEDLVIRTGSAAGSSAMYTFRTHSKSFGDRVLAADEHSKSLPAPWLSQRFPWLTKHWDSVKALPHERALAWAEDQRVEGLRSRNPSLFGIEIKGEHLAYIGPFIVVAGLLYLLSFLVQLERYLSRGGRDEQAGAPALSPWIGSMTNAWAQVVTRVTLTAGPFMAVWLPLWRLLGLHWLLSALLGLAPARVGYKSAKLSRGIAYALEGAGEPDSGPLLGERPARLLKWACSIAGLALAASAPIFLGGYYRIYHTESFMDTFKPIGAVGLNTLVYALLTYYALYSLVWVAKKR